MSEKYDYFISAGEPSGDVLGGELVKALNKRDSDIKGFGVVGPNMKAEGVRAIADIEELSVMGFIEVFKQIGSIKSLEIKIVEYVRRYNPKSRYSYRLSWFSYETSTYLAFYGSICLSICSTSAMGMGAMAYQKAQKSL